MSRFEEATLVRKDIVDTVRTIARLQGRIALRHRLNEVENDILEAYDKAVASGEPYTLDVKSILEAA